MWNLTKPLGESKLKSSTVGANTQATPEDTWVDFLRPKRSLSSKHFYFFSFLFRLFYFSCSVFPCLQCVKMHASVKKDLVARYVNHLPIGQWRFIETFSLNQAGGQFRPTPHAYKMSFVTGTMVTRSENKSDSNYLCLAKFEKILSGALNPSMLIGKFSKTIWGNLILSDYFALSINMYSQIIAANSL